MFYQEALPKFWFVSRVDSLLTIIGDRHWQKLAAMFKKSRITKFTPLKGAFSCGLMWGAYFCMGAYKCDVVIVMKMGAYIHEVLILCGYLLSRFYGSLHLPCDRSTPHLPSYPPYVLSVLPFLLFFFFSSLPLALFPGSCAGEEEREPGTHCSHMRQVPLVTCILLSYTKIMQSILFTC